MILRRKLGRDFKENRAAFLACILIIAMGLSVYVSMAMTCSSLIAARDTYYREYRLAEAFAKVEAIPYNTAFTLPKKIPGLKAVQAKFSRDVRVLELQEGENVYLRLLGYDFYTPDQLNQIYIFSGKYPDRADEIMISPEFAKANQLEAGDKIALVIGRKRAEFTVTGTAQSPEYVYTLRDGADMFPNPKGFGIGYVAETTMNQLFASSGIVNELSFTLQPGTEFLEVKESLRQELEPYRLSYLVERKDQISNFMLENEIKQLQNMGRSIPLMMLLISAAILYIMLKRMIETQRGHIGIMYAFGYTRGEVLRHYLAFGFWTGFLGAVLGTVFGVFLLNFFVNLYQEFFTIPEFIARIEFRYVLYNFILAMVICLLAAYMGARKILKLSPMEALHPPAPASAGKIWLERFAGLWNMLTVQGKMAVRNISRSPLRSFFTVIGIAFVFAMSVVVFSFNRVLDVMIVKQFAEVEVYDFKIALNGWAKEKALQREVGGYPGIKKAETMLELPVTLKNRNLKKEVMVLGLSRDADLYQLRDTSGDRVELSQYSLVIAQILADSLEVKAGDTIFLDTPWIKEAVPVVISAVIPQYLGSNAYMDKSALQEVIKQKEAVNTVLVKSDDAAIEAFKQDYLLAEKVASIKRNDEIMSSFSDFMGLYSVMILVMVSIVSIIGFAIVFNSGIVTFSERKRELASLMVLGMDESEVAEVINAEQWFLAVLAIALGFPLAQLFNLALLASVNSELYSMPNAINAASYIGAILATAAYILAAQRRVRKRLKTLVMVDVLKERE